MPQPTIGFPQGALDQVPNWQTCSDMKLRIAVADDNSKMLGALVSTLSTEFDVVATASDGRSALDQIRALEPSVAVLDLNMPELNGIEVTREIKRLGLASEVVICSVEGDSEIIAAALKAGALGYVLKPAMNRDLGSAVKCVSCGELFVSGAYQSTAHHSGRKKMITTG